MEDSCEGIEDTEEDHPRKVNGVRPKPAGRRELLNLECSINYELNNRWGHFHIIYYICDEAMAGMSNQTMSVPT